MHTALRRLRPGSLSIQTQHLNAHSPTSPQARLRTQRARAATCRSHRSPANTLSSRSPDLTHTLTLTKVNELVKRVRLLKAHTYVLHELRDAMPSFMGISAKKKKLCEEKTMGGIFRAAHTKYNIPPGDFPDISKFCSIAKELEFTEFPRVDGGRLKNGKLMQVGGWVAGWVVGGGGQQATRPSRSPPGPRQRTEA